MSHDDYSISDAVGASVIDESPTTVLVEFDDGTVESLDKHSTIGMLCQLDSFDANRDVQAGGRALLSSDTIDRGGSGVPIEFTLDPSSGSGEIRVRDLDTLTVTGEELANSLRLVSESIDRERSSVDQTDISLPRDQATRLYRLYEDVISGRVRQDVIDSVVNTLSLDAGGRLDRTSNGYVVQDTYLVTWEAENYLADDVTTYERDGGDVVETDDEPQALGVTFRTEPRHVVEISGSEVILTEKEQRFLGTLEVLLQPEAYLEVETFQQEAYQAILEATGEDVGPLRNIAVSVEIDHYVDPTTGLLHRHGVDKHVLRSTFDVNFWVIDELHYNSWDHAGLQELAWREAEFRDADRDVFRDTDNDDDERWNRIQDRADGAPCPPEVYTRLRGMYGT